MSVIERAKVIFTTLLVVAMPTSVSGQNLSGDDLFPRLELVLCDASIVRWRRGHREQLELWYGVCCGEGPAPDSWMGYVLDCVQVALRR